MANTQYDKLLSDVLEKTRDKDLAWTVTRNNAFAEHVLHGATIFRSFMSDYTRSQDHYTLAFVEKKVPHPEDERFDQHIPELLVLKDDNLILLVDEYHVDASDLRKLSALITERNADAQGLLNSF